MPRPKLRTVSAEELTADAENCSKSCPSWIAPPTRSDLVDIFKLWEEYKGRIQKNISPSVQYMKFFFTTVAKERPGLIGDYMTVRTLTTLSATKNYEREYDIAIPKTDREQVQDVGSYDSIRDEITLTLLKYI